MTQRLELSNPVPEMRGQTAMEIGFTTGSKTRMR
jgi:hypothetical protein